MAAMAGEGPLHEQSYSQSLHPLGWRDWADGAQVYDSGPIQLDGVIIQRWAGSAAQMRQPPLGHHYLSFHQGGAKRVTRRGDGATVVRNVKNYAVTTVAAGHAYDWTTAGPIAFTHVYVEPDRFARTIDMHREAVHADVRFAETVGQFDPLICRLMHRLIQRSLASDTDAMATEILIDSILLRLYDTLVIGRAASDRIRLTEANLRRVRDFVASNLRQRIMIEDMAAVTGYSRFHFARAFTLATGMPPYAFVINERIAAARNLLATTNWPIDAIARATGFTSHAQFTTSFRQLTGITLSRFRGLASPGSS